MDICSHQTQKTYKDQVLYCFGLMKFEAGESIKKTAKTFLVKEVVLYTII